MSSNKEMATGKIDYVRDAAMSMTDSLGRYDKETKEIKKDLEVLKADVVGLAHKALDEGSETVAEVKKKAGVEVERLRGLGVDSLKRAEEYVREKPAQSLAIALLAGFVFSAFFGRK